MLWPPLFGPVLLPCPSSLAFNPAVPSARQYPPALPCPSLACSALSCPALACLGSTLAPALPYPVICNCDLLCAIP